MRCCRFQVALVAFIAALLVVAAARAESLATSFTYQGALNFQGQPLNGTADFQFSLFDAVSRGNQTGSTIHVNVLPVNGGTFAVSLDFGVDVFNGDARYLEIAVRSPAGSGPFTTLAPRTTVSAAPYALQTRGIFVNTAGQVSIGPTEKEAALAGPITAQLRVSTPASNATAIHGKADAVSGIAEGVKGTSRSNQGRGVIGEVTASSGNTVGVLGKSDSPAGEGVRGEGATGVFGASDESAGVGLLGEATGPGTAIGVSGTSTSTTGEGVRGEGATGVCGASDNAAGVGVVGEATGPGSAIGVSGTSTSPIGEGVRGEGATGVCGASDDAAGVGVVGEATGSGSAIGVSGTSMSPTGEGVHGEGATGVCGVGMHHGPGIGVLGAAAGPGSEGVHGDGETGVCGESNHHAFGIGVLGAATGSSSTGVRGEGATGVCGQGTGFGSAGVEGLALTNEPETAGVRGKNWSVVENAAGVVAEGNGAMSPGVPRAAALNVRNGAIIVSGDSRPAGRLMITPEPGTNVVDSAGDSIGRFKLVDLVNDLITPESFILVTFEKAGPPNWLSFSAAIFETRPGEATIQIMRYGHPGGAGDFQGQVHYLIINPSPLR